ncbi:SRPBCC domain-containing protein [Robertmurraya yapensis]|uniref:SRPBCC domain-containing protein n=1 Tax=Bacillus yapensis TaxID=2492960 RepID=A0A3S0RQP5_9BACI|nr:SRPBCC domain-containing protein [Bacillus yapensis]RTR34083.1 SRPBCC domain-containing protein [Bacillus yapensis]TKS97401.1 SRPBCC domain-containing protein [Bacillus yapensis]
MSTKMISKVEGNVLILEREFDAPKELVFKAFSEPEHLKQWWGPRGWTVPVCNVDFRPGGVWHYCMKCVDENQGDFFGMESWGKGVYEEIIQDEKIVYRDYFSDAEGNEAEGMPSTRVTLLFEEQDGKTKLINRAEYDSSEALKTVLDMGMEQGITETWDRLEEHLASTK